MNDVGTTQMVYPLLYLEAKQNTSRDECSSKFHSLIIVIIMNGETNILVNLHSNNHTGKKRQLG